MAKLDNGAKSAAFSEIAVNPPRVLATTAKKYGPQRAAKQRVAIALSKARKGGAKLPNPKMGSNKY